MHSSKCYVFSFLVLGIGQILTRISISLCTLSWACFFFSYVFWGMKGIFILFGFLVWRKRLLSSIWPKKIIFYFGETCIYVAPNTITVSVLSTRLPRYLVPEGLTHFFLGLYKCILLRTGLLEQLISLCNLSYLNVHDTLTSAKKMFNDLFIIRKAIANSPILPLTWWCDCIVLLGSESWLHFSILDYDSWHIQA